MAGMYKLLITIILISCNNTPGNDKSANTSKRDKLKALQESNPFTFSTYCNERFSYCIGYPVFLIYPQPETGSADGRVFTNKQGEEVLRVFGKLIPYRNTKPISLEEQYNNDFWEIENDKALNDLVITEKRLSKTYYILSGYTKSRVFYQKTIVKNLAFAYVILQYEKAEKNIYDKVAGKILDSFN
jgi:hypothetical protein